MYEKLFVQTVFIHYCLLITNAIKYFLKLGIGGVYKGLTATIIKQGSNQAIRFFVMETCKDWYRGGDPSKPVPKLLVGTFGAIAGAASVFGNTPVDVVKTRMQVRIEFASLSVFLCLTNV